MDLDWSETKGLREKIANGYSRVTRPLATAPFRAFGRNNHTEELERLGLALEDRTGGWRDHVWDRYGRDIVDCVQVARGEGGEVVCTVKVRPP